MSAVGAVYGVEMRSEVRNSRGMGREGGREGDGVEQGGGGAGRGFVLFKTREACEMMSFDGKRAGWQGNRRGRLLLRPSHLSTSGGSENRRN